MAKRIEGFRELRVYRAAFEAAMDIFRLTRQFPPDERYSLTGQIRRFSRSVCANIAESWRKRRYPAAFVAKLSDAEAEAAETQVWLEFSLECGYLTGPEARTLLDLYDKIQAQLVLMLHDPGKWVIK